jgi:hypothetical protein
MHPYVFFLFPFLIFSFSSIAFLHFMFFLSLLSVSYLSFSLNSFFFPFFHDLVFVSSPLLHLPSSYFLFSYPFPLHYPLSSCISSCSSLIMLRIWRSKLGSILASKRTSTVQPTPVSASTAAAHCHARDNETSMWFSSRVHYVSHWPWRRLSISMLRCNSTGGVWLYF